ncbi:MAG: PKD domain-containing protein [Anaerolineae bacterium]|nr:PKD domain-containing protein [Anaerolineae bacterium]
MKQNTPHKTAVYWQKVQANLISIFLSGCALLGLLTLFSSQTDPALANNGAASDPPGNLMPAGQESLLFSVPAAPMMDGLDNINIVWSNHAISGFTFAVTALASEPDGRVWLGGGRSTYAGSVAISYWEDNEFTPITFASSASEIREIAVDEDGNLWVATDAGAARRDDVYESWQYFGNGTGLDLDSNNINSVAVQEELVWFGTGDVGARLYNPTNGGWTPYQREGAGNNQICDNTIHQIAIADNGSVWFGTNNGICELDTNLSWTYHLTGTVQDVAFAPTGEMWVTRPGIGISVLSTAGNWTHYAEAPEGEEGLTDAESVWSITVDALGQKWIGFQGLGVDLLSADNQDWLHITYPDISNDIVNDILETTNGDIWLGVNRPAANTNVASRGIIAVSGLTAVNNSPTLTGNNTSFTATLEHGSGASYTWNFGDGNPTSVGITATHTYAALGSYTAVVTASNSVSQMTATTTILVDEPIAGLTAVNDSPSLFAEMTTFTATVTSGHLVSYLWDFGDGVTQVGEIVTHTYTTIGVYTAVVTATNAFNTVTTTTPVTITEVPITGLAAANSSPSIADTAVHFTATTTGGSNITYAWDFGDSALGSGANAVRVYAEPGSYTAVVTASNTINIITATTIVTIEPDLADLIVNQAGPANPNAGAHVIYDITIANQGSQQLLQA